MSITDLTTATPPDIDAELARIGGEMDKHHANIQRAQRTIQLELDHPAPSGDVNQTRIDQAQTVIDRGWAACAALLAELAPLDREFHRRGTWTRYFLVDNDNGHVHRNASNSACSRQPSTRHIWLTDQSGRPEGDLVADAGERACAVCFPWAPVEHLSRPSMFRTPTELERQSRAAEREKRAVEKRAKAITNPDGSPLRIKSGNYFDTVRTTRAAEIEVVDIQFRAKCHGRALTVEDVENVATLVTALAVKLQKDEGTVRSDATVRLIKKCKREQVTY
jgi:hypothetical protein